jgi:hypothetical protein
MSYFEADGQVVLTMSREEFRKLLEDDLRERVEFWTKEILKRLLNEGNPNYTKYQVKP